MSRLRWAWAPAAGGLLLAALYLLTARGLPIGALQDDATHIILAQSLRHGGLSLPDAFGGHPATDPMPGFAFLLAVPAWLAAPRWDLLKIVSLAAAAAALFFFRRLAARALGRGGGDCAAVLLALNPCFVAHAGFVVPDMLFVAFALWLCDSLRTADSAQGLAKLATLAAFASLLRPLGLVLPLFMGAALARLQGPRRAAVFMAAALAPLAAWLARNHLLAGSVTRYMDHAIAQVARLGEPGAMARHAAALLASFFGDGLLSLGHAPFAVQALLGATALILAGLGARRLMRSPEAPAAFVLAGSAAAWLCAHLDWVAVEPRYALPLLPASWMFIVAGATPFLRCRAARAGALAALLAPALLGDLALARAGWRGPAHFQPRTMSWIRSRTPRTAVVESLQCHVVILWTGRRSHVPHLDAANRDEWLAFALRGGADYLHTVDTFPATEGLVSAKAGRLAPRLCAWAGASAFAALVYRDPEEGTAVYRIRHPAPARFLAAWKEYEAAGTAFRSGRGPEEVRRRLRMAVAQEPSLAHAWAALALFEESPSQRRADLRHACAADPRDQELRELLAAELHHTVQDRPAS